MGENLKQQLAGIVHEPLFQVFINMQKSYDSLYGGIRMEILRGYVLGPKLQRLLHRYRDEQKVVPKAGKLFGCPLNMERRVT